MYRKTLAAYTFNDIAFAYYCSIYSELWCNRKHLKRQKPENVARTTIFWLPLLMRLMTCLSPAMITGLAPPLFPVLHLSLQFRILSSHGLEKSREVVSRCLPSGVFMELPSSASVSFTVSPSSLIQGCATKIGRLPHTLLPQRDHG